MNAETAFEMATSRIRFGAGVTREIGMDLKDADIEHVMVLTDPKLSRLPPVASVLESLDDQKIAYSLFDQVHVEPTDESFQEAIAFAGRPGESGFDGFVAVGGGSVIDTAKTANLYASYPADFMAYVNAPIGQAKPVPGPLKPLIAVPTTIGTGSETTGVAIFDLAHRRVKTGIAHRHLKPTLGLLDPLHSRTLPSQVAACTGLDVLCHAVESYTAIPFDQRPRAQRPALRPAYQGSNPISDVWALQALRMVNQFLLRAVNDAEDAEARGMMLLAASYAGLGFGNAGVHLPHAVAYPVAGMVSDYQPEDYAVDHPIVPHGMSVILHASAVFKFTAAKCPQRHLQAAEALGVNIDRAASNDAGTILADRIVHLMQQLGMPNGLSAIGYTTDDLPALVGGALAQERLTSMSPRPVGEQELSELFEQAMRCW